MKNFYLVAIGASAGGLEVLSQLISELPSKIDNASFIIAQHLSPSHKSQLAYLLSRKTTLAVEEAEEKKVIRTGTIYIIPNNTDLLIEKGKMALVNTNSIYHPSIDRLFESVAENYGPQAVGIVLSGTGSDGIKGISKIKSKSGFTYAQDPGEARFNVMPQNAISTGSIDMVAKVKDIAHHLKKYILQSSSLNQLKDIGEFKGNAGTKILKSLLVGKGVDFGNYKTSTISRRLKRRADQLHLNDLESYFKYIKSEPKELDILYSNFLIGVTSFFRDKEVFLLLKEKLVSVVKNKKKGDFIRIWVPGCATGEEPYTIAIILSEILGKEQEFYNVQILASDVDENALQKARKGLYGKDTVKQVGDEFLEKYFEPVGDEYQVVKQIRNNLLFSKHDLTASPPFFKIDLISCRNLLIYINQRTQNQIMQYFYYALNPGGLLLLGKSESVGNFKELFAEVDCKNKFYTKKLGVVQSYSDVVPLSRGTERIKKELWSKGQPIRELVRDATFRFFDIPYAIVNPDMNIIHIKGDLFPFITLQPGIMSSNILHLADESIRIELRALFTKMLEEKAPVKSKVKRVTIAGKGYLVRLQMLPVPREKTEDELYIIPFEQLEGEFLNSIDPLTDKQANESKRFKELEEELRETKAQLQSFLEELETSNEEMQSLNEELQSANEELQASNEELETSNEELQSASDEMLIAYNELQELHRLLEEKDKSLQKSHSQFNTLLEYSEQAYLLIDRNYSIVTFNKKANYIIERTNEKRLNESDSIFNYVPPNYLGSFKENIDLALKGTTTVLENFVPSNRGDFWLRVKYTPVFGFSKNIDNVLVSYIDLTPEIKSHQLVAHSQANLASFIENNKGLIYSIDKDYKYVIINSNFRKLIKDYVDVEVMPGDHALNFLKKINEIEYGSWKDVYERAFNGESIQLEKEFDLAKGTQHIEFFIHPVIESNEVIGLSCSGYDITYKVLNEKKIKESEVRFRALIENSQNLISMIDENGHIIYSSPAMLRILPDESTAQPTSSLLSHIHFDDLPSTRTAIKEVLLQKAHPVYHSFRLKGTGESWMYLEGILTNMKEVEGVNAIVANFKDVSERVKAEEIVHKNQSLFKAIIENSMDMKALFTADSEISYASPSIFKILGYSDAEFYEKKIFELIHREDVENFAEKVHNLLFNEGVVLSIEQRIMHKDGRYIWCEGTVSNLLHNPYVRSVVYNFRDVSDRKQANEKLKETYSLLENALKENEKILNRSLDVICSIDSEGRFIKVSAASIEIWGYTPDELSGKKYMDYVYYEDHLLTAQTAEEIMSGVEKTTFENRYVRKDGSLVPMLWSARWEESEKIMYCIAKNASEKKRLEKAFETEKARFADMFFNAPACIGILRGPEHVFEQANPQYIELFGKDDVIGKKVKEVFPELKGQGFYEILDKVFKTGETYSASESLIKVENKGNGELADYYLNFVYQAFRNQEGDIEGIFFFAVDVSEQVLARKKIEESEMKYRSFFDNSMDGILLTVPDGRIIAANPAACKIFGRPEEEICAIGRDGIVDLTDPNLAGLLKERLETSKANGELTFIRKDGSKFPGETTSVIFKDGFGNERTSMIIRDISERKKSEEKLIQSELSLKEAQKLSNMGSWAFDLAKDEIIWSDEVFRIFNVDPHQRYLTYEEFINFIHPDDRNYVSEKYSKSIEDKEDLDIIHRIVTREGVLKYVHERCKTFYDHNGKPIRSAGTVHDITTRKLTELERDKTTADLIQRNKDLEQFAYIVSHNLRSPVANILGCVQILSDPSFDQETKIEILEGLATASKKLDSVIWDLNYILQIKRDINEKKQLIKFDDLIEDIKISIDHQIKKDEVTIKTNFEGLPEILSLRTYLYSIFYNLISNSIKYRQESVAPLIEIMSTKDNNIVKLTFKDNGRGIDLIKKGELVFGLYKRFHPEIEGKGMGLFMIKTQVETLGGRISIQSEVNKGTTFTILFEQLTVDVQ